MALAQAHSLPLPMQNFRPEREQRATQRALVYWNSIRKDEALPRFNDFRFAHQEVNESTRFLLKQDHMAPNSVFILCGESVAYSFGGDPVRKTLAETAPTEVRSQINADCEAAVTGSAPAGSEGWYVSHDDSSKIYYRYIFLPLEASYSRLGYVFGAYSCKSEPIS